jgi:sulfopyruvate decarboxylase TPP-binding subunit
MTWSDTFLAALKDNDVRLISYVPDNVLTPLLKGVAADNYFLSVNATREDEALGRVAWACLIGLRGASAWTALSSRPC